MPGEFRKREIVGNQYIVTHLVDDSNDGLRIDQFVKKHYRTKSRNQIQKAIAGGEIRMRLREDGQLLRPSTRLIAGDEVQVVTERFDEPNVNFGYKVLFEDDDLLVLDKPANLPVHPAGRFLFNTLLTNLRKERSDWVLAGKRDFYITHRLDRETSGVIALAKNPESAAWMVRQFRERETEKRYFAICYGHVSEKLFTVDLDIGPAQGSNIRLRVGVYPKGTELLRPESGAQNACTHFTLLQHGPNVSLLDCKIETGRQHQIRAHLAAAGYPVVGDKLYSGDESIFLHYLDHGVLTDEMKHALGFERHALHSRYLRFFHETRGEWLEIESALPADMKRLLECGTSSRPCAKN
ncbi:MAG TPA: RluA family pseudouridine synthase [Oligoflexia bacterium]|nr:RluA family pseudouridine synthase [Oligoflexia bacterium]